MQSALTCLAIGTALGTASVSVAKSPTATFEDGYYIFVNDASSRPLTGLKPFSPTAIKTAGDEKPTQMSSLDDSHKAKTPKLLGFGPWVASALTRIEELKKSIPAEVEQPDHATAARAIRDAESILLKLALAGLAKRPAIGWDSSGAVSFYVKSGEFSADFTAYGDGKFSFAAKRVREPSISDELDVGDPLPKALTDFLV